jgi:hypothetical protein
MTVFADRKAVNRNDRVWLGDREVRTVGSS